MNEFLFEIPAIPLGLIALLNFFAPYAAAIPINPSWSTAKKRVVAVVTALVIAAIVLAVAWGLGFEIPSWPLLLVLGVALSQAAYDLVLKKSADKLSANAGSK